MKLTSRWPDATRHLIGLVVGWLGFSIFLGLFYEFDRMEASSDAIPALHTGLLFTETTLIFIIGISVLSAPIIIWWLLNGNKKEENERT